MDTFFSSFPFKNLKPHTLCPRKPLCQENKQKSEEEKISVINIIFTSFFKHTATPTASNTHEFPWDRGHLTTEDVIELQAGGTWLSSIRNLNDDWSPHGSTVDTDLRENSAFNVGFKIMNWKP